MRASSNRSIRIGVRLEKEGNQARKSGRAEARKEIHRWPPNERPDPLSLLGASDSGEEDLTTSMNPT